MRLEWNKAGERFYEAGVDRGVLYSGASAAPWNGLVAVNEEPSGGQPQAYYVDGVKLLELMQHEEFEATLEAYTYPDLFNAIDGVHEIVNGLYASQQLRSSFNLCYRTRVGNENTSDLGYKIHLVYTAYAQPTSRPNATLSDSPEASLFSWKITTRAVSATSAAPVIAKLPGYRRSSHFIVDTRKTPMETVRRLEDMLYGTVDADPDMPSIAELVGLLATADAQFVGNIDGGVIDSAQTTVYDGGATPSTAQVKTYDGGVP